MIYFLIGLISIFVFVFVLAIALASKGFVNKFGPEWIPGELGIRFNLMSPLIMACFSSFLFCLADATYF